jgi:hypothetical protein
MGKKFITKQKKQLHLLYTLDYKHYVNVLWSPAGNMCAITTHGQGGGDIRDIMFHDVTTNTLMATRSHDKCKKVEWCPSGRYLVSRTMRAVCE